MDVRFEYGAGRGIDSQIDPERVDGALHVADLVVGHARDSHPSS
jgi:hypothetical protein